MRSGGGRYRATHRRRHSRLAAIALGTLCALGLATAAHATSSLTLRWERDGNLFDVTSGNEEGLAKGVVVAQADSAGIGGFSISLFFDEEGLDLVDIAPDSLSPGIGGPGGQEQTVNLPGPGNSFVPYVSGYGDDPIESSPGSGGRLGTFDYVATGTGLVSATRTLGSVWFQIREVPLDDVAATTNVELAFVDGIDFAFDAGGNAISDSIQLTGARIEAPFAPPIPEASVAHLLVGGLAGLILASRGRRTRSVTRTPRED